MNALDQKSITNDLERTCKTLLEQVHAMEETHKLAISQISHEIRNPVTLINSSLQLIEKEHPEVKKYALWTETIKDMHYLCQLLDELSAYNNGTTLNIAPIQTEEWLNEMAASFETLNASKNISFSYYIETPLPCLIGDALKLRQAFFNLIRNSYEALSDTGDISFIITMHRKKLCIEIRDTGCGISDEDMIDLFKPFVTHKAGGSGLGLAIAKRIIDAHNGHISCFSQKGVGTVFTVLLPISSS